MCVIIRVIWSSTSSLDSFTTMAVDGGTYCEDFNELRYM